VKRETQDWLPPESLGLKIGDEYVDLDPKEIPGLRGRVERAIAEGETNIGHGAAVLPASEDTLRALEALIGECRPTGPAGTDSARASSEPSRGASEAPLVLQVHPNFEAVDYRARSRPRGGQGLEAVSDLVRNNPYPHQRTALEWLLAHWTEGSPGALLADDMGLGKTFQTLAFLAWVRSLMVRGLYPRRPFVVVAPTGLLTNWQEEEREHIQRPGLGRMVEAFGPWLRVLKTKGDSLDGGGPDLPVLHEARLRDAGWVLTSYETWRDYQLSFGRIRWAIAVFDEVQKVKNPKAGVTEAAKAVNADFTLALTGTPVENRLADLWCVVDLVQPGRLGSLKEFSHTYETPALTEASGEVASLKAEILEKPPPLMLRRMKEDHLEGLPEIFHHAEKRPMPTMQAEAYAQAVRSYQEEAGNPGQMLKLLGRLRSISLHPTEQGGTSDPSYIRSSARLRVLFEVLEEVHGRGEKALVFVESREMQAALIGILQRHFGLSERPLVINGAVSGHKRQERVHRFQRRRGFDVMLLSPKAGGVGLTLTAANHVIHLSRWWNPAVEDQCTDRVFRIGQSKPVHVYYPLAVHPEFEQHSFDLTLDELMRWKRAMGRAVLAPDALSPDEIRDLFEATIRQGAPRRSPADLPAVDTMEPLAFERWVMGILQGLGYTVDRTPSTHDHGADAVARGHEVGPDLLVQCKHTQSQRSIGPEAVREVLAAMGAYGGAASFQGVVFTNGEGFTGSARDLAKANQVALVGRATLNRGVTLNDVFPPTP
jgi:superfamily II DNA or RNA helicase